VGPAASPLTRHPFSQKVNAEDLSCDGHITQPKIIKKAAASSQAAASHRKVALAIERRPSTGCWRGDASGAFEIHNRVPQALSPTACTGNLKAQAGGAWGSHERLCFVGIYGQMFMDK
jgi:hypothetical protein